MRRTVKISSFLLGVAALAVSGCGGGGGGGGGGKISGNTLTIWSSVPLQGAAADQGKAITNGAKLAWEGEKKIGKYTIQYKPTDDSLASTGAADEGKAAQNARMAVADKTSVGYIGEYNSGISKVTIPILNQAGIAQISPSNTYAGLTTNKVPGTDPGEPTKYYPTGKRTYARIPPIDTVQAAALLLQLKADGCKTAQVWNSKTTYSAGLSKDITILAPKAGIKMMGDKAYDPKAANYRALAANMNADCFINTGEIESNANQGLKDVASAKPNAKIYESDGDCLNASANPDKGVPPAVAPKFHCTIATLDPKSFGPEGKKFFSDYSKTYHTSSPDPYAIYGYESMALLLDSIKRASANGTKDITRQAVVNAVFQTKNRNSVLGTYSLDSEGDSSITDYGLYKIAGKTLTFQRVISTKPLLPNGAKQIE